MSAWRLIQRASGGVARAFSMIEMLVVVLIIGVLITLALPAFNALVAANTQAQAVEAVRSGLTLARSAAVNGPSGADSAAVFFFEPGGVVQIVPCVRVGVIDDRDDTGGTVTSVVREVFAPPPGATVISLPRGFTVRGFVPAGRMVRTSGGGSSASDPSPGWYAATNGNPRYGLTPTRGDWVFPETGFYRRNFGTASVPGDDDDGMDRSTFMVRFEGGSGRPVVSNQAPVLVLAPRASASARGGGTATSPADPSIPAARHRLDLATSLPAAFESIRVDGQLSGDAVRRLIGTSDPSGGVRSSDTVMAGPVTELAVMDEGKLAASLGLRVDGFTGVLYRVSNRSTVLNNPAERFVSDTTASADLGPYFVEPPAGFDEAGLARLIALWIEGASIRVAGVLVPNAGSSSFKPVPAADPPARLFAVDRSSGAMIEVAPNLPEGAQ